MRTIFWTFAAAVAFAGCSSDSGRPSSERGGASTPPAAGMRAPTLPVARTAGALEVVATFSESMPTGVTVASGGRIFVNYPRWGDPVPFTVAEVRNGRAAAYPDADVNRLDPNRPRDTVWPWAVRTSRSGSGPVPR